MAERYLCIHGHFYQPPRENPWLEAIERQETAYPYHDWNERVSAECYAPNAASRILDPQGRIVRILNNYSRISFNVGPTLLSWLEVHEPDVYRAILDADRESRERFSGHGSALAQVWGHLILPLANRRDRVTQIRWGIEDFRHRFGRDPEGMWLPETAVDLESLDLMAREGIRYTILAPHQAHEVRSPDGEWGEVGRDELVTTRPYRVDLPSGRSLAVFFYHGALAREVAFEDLLDSGEDFARRLAEVATRAEHEAPLAHLATDGESYGHHHTHGEMALSSALEEILDRPDLRLTNYGEYLERHPPRWEARIRENTSWSCSHGVERWRSDCGCSAGRGEDWSQEWREPLREALDWLRDELSPLYETAAGEHLSDPWEARDRYIEVCLDRSDDGVERFFRQHADGPLDDEERVRALELLELQRQALLMYTSCGWFFDEISDLETVQVMRYAGRAVHLAKDLFGRDLEGELEERLSRAPSNRPEVKNGAVVYREEVLPSRIVLADVAAHYAVSSLFERYQERDCIYCYVVEREEEERHGSGDARLFLGRLRVRSAVTWKAASYSYAVLHMGDHNVIGGVRPHRGEKRYRALAEELASVFSRVDFPAVIRVLDRRFRASTYSLHSLFRDEQRKVVDRLLESAISDAEDTLSRLYQDWAPLMRFTAELGLPQPPPLRLAAEYTLNTRIRRGLEETEPDPEELRFLFDEAEREGVELTGVSLGYAAQKALEGMADRLLEAPEDHNRLRRLRRMIELVDGRPVPINFWGVQNRYYRVLQTSYPELRLRAEQGGEDARRWMEDFEVLGRILSVALPDGDGEDKVEEEGDDERGEAGPAGGG